ncbi:MAG: hypothetical protein K0S39_3203 [Paenibacillus sp.]|jgi:hypothetical protein|nr:hypothetical protein [Paenibacillus sp.]
MAKEVITITYRNQGGCTPPLAVTDLLADLQSQGFTFIDQRNSQTEFVTRYILVK